jgi:protocatechuate 3,4-dioxygenase beta subunit
VLESIADPARRATLIAKPGDAPGQFRFDVQLQGTKAALETVFFDV